MTQEQKDLLYKDMCARLPYGVKVRVTPIPELEHLTYDAKLFNINTNNIFGVITDDNVKYIPHNVEEIKPYIFPLSSMTEEQFDELKKLGYLENCAHCREIPFKLKWIKTFSLPLLHWLLENHFDINDLIPTGLAKDATGLNIY